MASNTMNVLYGLAERISKLAVNCSGCSTCCHSGLVYVFAWEESALQQHDVPFFTMDGVTFIERQPNGCCPMLHHDTGLCSIYANRPFCCRLFPVDLFSRHGRLEWGLYAYCPTEKRRMRTFAGSDRSRLCAGQIADAVALVEKNVDPADVSYLYREDRICAAIELLDEHRSDFSIIANLACSTESPRPT